MASKLDKHVLLWKVQEAPFEYDMCFHVSLPDLKSVTVTRHYLEMVVQEVMGDDGTVQEMETFEEASVHAEFKEFSLAEQNKKGIL